MPRHHVLVLAAALGACAGDGPRAPVLAGVTPAYGPLVGGTRVVVEGQGFLAAGAPGNRVLIGGREAPLVATLDDASLEVVIPPGLRAGAAEVLVFNAHGAAAASDLFRYSAPPTIAEVTPARVVFDAPATITVTGSGFQDEGAGEVVVLVDGTPVTDVVVLDDTALTFTAPPGRALATADVEVIDARGSAREPRGYRYVPSLRPGLLLFSRTFGAFAVYYDPADGRAVTIPRTGGSTTFTAVVADPAGELWAVDRIGRYGRVDLARQELVDPVPLSHRVPAMARGGDELFAIIRTTARVGRLDPIANTFVPFADGSLGCCGSYGVAFDGTHVYTTARRAGVVELRRFDPLTGTSTAPVPLVGDAGVHIEDLRFFAGTLYATTRTGELVTIDPATGAIVVIATPGRATAIAIFE